MRLGVNCKIIKSRLQSSSMIVKYVLKYCGKAGQRNTSECSQESGTHGTEGLASAQRLCPHGMAVPYFGEQGWAKAQPGHAKNRTKEEMSCWIEYLDYLILWLRNPLYIVIDKQ